MEFPIACCRCGLCCISSPCLVAIEQVPDIDRNAPCPRLDMSRVDTEGAVCSLFQEICCRFKDSEEVIRVIFGIGAGCCIKATAVNLDLGTAIDFSELHPETKRGGAKLAFKRKTGKTPWLPQDYSG